MLSPAIRAAVVALLGLAVASCTVDRRTDELSCEGPADCADGRVCQAGWCVAVGDGPDALAGFALAIPRDDTLIIDVVAVDPAFQHQGIGRRLIVHAEAQARVSGMRRIDLAVDEMMWETLGLYARLGYQEIDRREQEGSVRVQFRKYLGWHP